MALPLPHVVAIAAKAASAGGSPHPFMSPSSRTASSPPPPPSSSTLRLRKSLLDHRPKGVGLLLLPRGLSNSAAGLHSAHYHPISSLKVRPMNAVSSKRRFSRCLATILDTPDIAPLSWVAFVDQILLITTIAFAYLAGVVPNNHFYPIATNNTTEGRTSNLEANFPGGYATNKTSTNSDSSWVKVEQKLLDALDAGSDGLSSCDSFDMNCPSSLLALREGSRLRLLMATLTRLRKEVWNISHVHEESNHDARLVTFSKTIRESIQPIFLAWLEGELSMQKKGNEQGHMYGVLGKLEANDSPLQKIKLLAKADLYGDLIFYLRFGSLGSYYYDESIIVQNEVEILEDLVITLAEGICSIFLELISLDSTLSPEGSYLGPSLCSLSTRALQKLRNQAALDQWLVQNFQSVISIYEDRFDLFVLKKEPLKEPDVDITGTFNLLKHSFFQKQTSKFFLHRIAIIQSPIFVRRTKELKALAGWRYYYSLFLELSDISMPLVRAAVVKARNAISFFLTCLIGRSLGLIYAGIRQSLGWR